jgi:hypothetical protein
MLDRRSGLNGIRSGFITHSAIGLKILSPYGIYAALPGLLGIRSLPKVEMQVTQITPGVINIFKKIARPTAACRGSKC